MGIDLRGAARPCTSPARKRRGFFVLAWARMVRAPYPEKRAHSPCNVRGSGPGSARTGSQTYRLKVSEPVSTFQHFACGSLKLLKPDKVRRTQLAQSLRLRVLESVSCKRADCVQVQQVACSFQTQSVSVTAEKLCKSFITPLCYVITPHLCKWERLGRSCTSR
jgi:hypothetical protein